MPVHTATPAVVPAPGGKVIEEFVGGLATGTASMSVAHMIAPPGWDEPWQRPGFDETTVVLRGTMRVFHDDGHTDVTAGQTILCRAGERIRYANASDAEVCEYWAVCSPAFSPDTVHREA